MKTGYQSFHLTGVPLTPFDNLRAFSSIEAGELFVGKDNILSLTSVLIRYYKETGGVKMNISQDIKPVTYLKSRAADLLKQINETHRPVIITQNGEPKAILQDPKSYENMRNAIGILKLISQGEDEIRSGKSKPQQEVFESIDNFLKYKMK